MNYEFNKQNFDKIMDQFIHLDLFEQRKQIIEDLKYAITIEQKLCDLNSLNFDSLYNQEVSYLKKEEDSEKEFLKIVYAYLYILKNGHYNFVNSTIKKLMNDGNCFINNNL